MNSIRVRDITANIIKVLVESMGSSFYAISGLKVDVSRFTMPACRGQLTRLLKKTAKDYDEQCGKPLHILHLSDEIDRPVVEEEMERAIVA
jgi:hypothetical protein